MHTASFEDDLEQVLKADQRYHRDAYLFLRDALEHTQKLVLQEEANRRAAPKGRQHVSPQQLLAGIKSLALKLYGPMSITVLGEWGIYSCRDFGEMVFILVEHRLLAKTENDSRTDFESGYDFQEAFRNPFLPLRKLNTVASKADGTPA